MKREAKTIKLRNGIHVQVEPTVTLSGYPCVDISHPNIMIDHGQMTLTPLEAERYGRALVDAARVARGKASR